MIKEGQRRGIYRVDIDARVAALVLLGSFENLLHVWVLGDKVPELKSKYGVSLEQGKEVVERLIKRGLYREDA